MKTPTPDEVKVKIESFIDAALRKEIPWNTLESFLDNLTPNLVRSKQVIKMLLRIIQDNQESSIDKVSNKTEMEYAFDEESNKFSTFGIEIQNYGIIDENCLDESSVNELTKEYDKMNEIGFNGKR